MCVCACASAAGHFSVGLALRPIHAATQRGPPSTRSQQPVKGPPSRVGRLFSSPPPPDGCSFQAHLLLTSNLGLSAGECANPAALARLTRVVLGLNYLWAPTPHVSCKQVVQGVGCTQIKGQVFPTIAGAGETDKEAGGLRVGGRFDVEGVQLCRVGCTSANGHPQGLRIGCFSCRLTA